MSHRKQRKPLPYSPQYGSYREQGSPTKASVLLQEDHADYIDNLQSRKQNFKTCLHLYRLSYDNQLPQKCFIHNNFITLYCENTFKLLCVNCIYGSAQYKDYRVVPSKNSLPNIQRDNEEMLKNLQEELARVKTVDTEMRKNRKLLEDQYRSMLKRVDQEFEDMFKMIQQQHETTKARVKEAFSRAIEVNDKGGGEVTWWRDMLVKTKNEFPKQYSEEGELYKHLVLNMFSEERIDDEKLTYLPSVDQIENDFMRQVIELREAIEQHAGPSPAYQPEKSNRQPRYF